MQDPLVIEQLPTNTPVPERSAPTLKPPAKLAS